MKIYSYCSETHREMYDRFFVPSLQEGWELDTLWMDQECQTGEFQSDGWMIMMEKKVEFIIDIIKKEWGGWFLFSDCDVQFFDDISDEMGMLGTNNDDVDMFSMDDVMPCAGFFVTKANKNALALWINVMNRMKETGRNDQLCLGEVLKIAPEMFRCKLLPRMKYFNYNHLFNTQEHNVWDGENLQPFYMNDLSDVKVHHANYTMGISNKIKMMEIVKNVKTNNLHTTS